MGKQAQRKKEAEAVTRSAKPSLVARIALVISVLAFAVSAWQFVEMRRFNRLRVRPAVTISYEFREDGAGWELTNNGLGPALVHWVEARVDDQPVHTWNDVVALLGVAPAPFHFSIPRGGAAVPSGDTRKLLWLQDPESSELFGQENRVKLRVCYCSVFGECFVAANFRPDREEFIDCAERSGSYLHMHRLRPPPPGIDDDGEGEGRSSK